ncbi:MAG: hypothetical protein KBC30_08850 [Planctomycetes bacterium]|jgi:hypothetical protein|nr:hypothetical protein [Planctomycetota bacterium]HPY75685.1 hypothetical protein [Planctomycetota bacterium]HQB01234.1 hypothetical protein [Planctomycetota bacterium]
MDKYIGQLLNLQFQLLQATNLWRNKQQISPEIEEIRKQTILINHKRYYELIPLYNHWVQSNHENEHANLETIYNELMLSGEIFKNYHPHWLEQNNFKQLTQWLRQRFTRNIRLDKINNIENIQQWRMMLQQQGIYLNYSSGSQGRLSFIPRDPMTYKALCTNPKYYSDNTWNVDQQGKIQPYNCLIAGYKGSALGIQGGGLGLSKHAIKVHYMFDQILDADMIQGKTKNIQSNQQKTIQFIQQTIQEKIPLLIYGTPFFVLHLCKCISSPLLLPTNSLIVTGGGWKTYQNQKLTQIQFKTLLQQTFPNIQHIDAYSSVEINCTFTSCSYNRYHIPPLIQPVVYDEALFVKQQGYGLIGLLDPFSISYPGFLLTGDQAYLSSESCPCGLHGWTLQGEITRSKKEEIKGCAGVMQNTFIKNM